jgi:hypothetical protein
LTPRSWSLYSACSPESSRRRTTARTGGRSEHRPA